MFLDKEKFKNALKLNSVDVDEEEFENIIEVVHPALNEVINDFIESGKINIDFNVQGVTVKDIIEKNKTDFLYSLVTMTVFIKNPDKALIFMDSIRYFKD